MKKVLYVATVARHIISFHIPIIKELKRQGFIVHVAANNKKNDYEKEYEIPYIDKFYNLSFTRSPLTKKNIQAYRDLKGIMQKENYDIVHCHTPVASVLTRLVKMNNNIKQTKIYYTAHGFHFNKQTSFKNWALYFPIEYVLSKYTDVLFTINDEDYLNAKKMKSKQVIKVPGVGVNLTKFEKITNESKLFQRNIMNYAAEDFILFFAAELNDNKNQKELLYAIKKINNRIPNLKLILAGSGPNKEELVTITKKLCIDKQVDFLGQIDNVNEYLKITDIAVSSSKREGLPVNLIESMATGIPAVVSNCRGNRDLIKNYQNGFVYNNIEELADYLIKMYEDQELYSKLALKTTEMAKRFSEKKVTKIILNTYLENLIDQQEIVENDKHNYGNL